MFFGGEEIVVDDFSSTEIHCLGDCWGDPLVDFFKTLSHEELPTKVVIMKLVYLFFPWPCSMASCV